MVFRLNRFSKSHTINLRFKRTHTISCHRPQAKQPSKTQNASETMLNTKSLENQKTKAKQCEAAEEELFGE